MNHVFKLKFTWSATVLADVVFLILRQTYEAKPRNMEASCSAQACQMISTRDHDHYEARSDLGFFPVIILIMMDDDCMIHVTNYS